MNLEQEKFIDFILERVEDPNQEVAKALLLKTFAYQENNPDNDVSSLMLNIIPLLKPDAIEEVTNIILYNALWGNFRSIVLTI
ncbi:MAG: hypothetical protein LBT13_04405 [Treponema sp.]|nr:hypothetical protein [Treponema sp.]